MSLVYENMIDLFKIKEQGDLASKKLKTEKVSLDEQQSLIKLVERGEQARTTLLAENLSLVDYTIHVRYSKVIVPYEDLVQGGRLGLLKAIDTFDYKLGYKLSTYADKLIRTYINETIVFYQLIGVSSYMINRVRKLRNYELEYEVIEGKSPSVHEIEENTGFTEKEIVQMRNLPVISASLNQPVGDVNEDLTLEDIIEDTSMKNASELFDIEVRDKELHDAIKTLSDIEQQIIHLRYGFDEEVKTLKETAEVVNLSLERVRQIQVEAIDKLKVYYKEK